MRWAFYINNSVDKTNYLVIPQLCSNTVSLGTYPLYSKYMFLHLNATSLIFENPFDSQNDGLYVWLIPETRCSLMMRRNQLLNTKQGIVRYSFSRAMMTLVEFKCKLKEAVYVNCQLS